MKFEKVLAAFEYEISGGSQYQWQCFGPYARFLDFGENLFYNGSVIHDTKTQKVYEVTVETDTPDYCGGYRWINPGFREAYAKESRERGIDPDIMSDDYKWKKVQHFDDMLEIIQKISNDQPLFLQPELEQEFEPAIEGETVIPVNLPKEDILKLAMLAHEQDITLNEFVNTILRNEFNREIEIISDCDYVIREYL